MLITQVTANREGFLAVVVRSESSYLVCGEWRNERWSISDAPGDLLPTVRDIIGGDVDASASFESSALRALNRWLDHRAASESTGANSAPSRARRAIHAQIDSLSLRAAVHTRAAYADRVMRVRALIDQSISAGAELMLEEIALTPANDLASLLGVCEERLGGALVHAALAANGGRVTIRAILLLRRPL